MHAVKDNKTSGLTTGREAGFFVPRAYPGFKPIAEVAATGAFAEFDPRKAPDDVMAGIVNGVRTPRASTPIPVAYSVGPAGFFPLPAFSGLKYDPSVVLEPQAPLSTARERVAYKF